MRESRPTVWRTVHLRSRIGWQMAHQRGVAGAEGPVPAAELSCIVLIHHTKLGNDMDLSESRRLI